MVEEISAGEAPASSAFHELIAPFVQMAGEALREPFGLSERVEAEALLPALEALRDRLCKVATPPMLAAFRAEVPVPPVARIYDMTPAFAPRERYRAFVEAAGDLSGWPVLRARLTDLRADFVRNMESFLRHLHADAAALAAFTPEWAAGLPKVTAIRPGLSDPHAGGRSVMRVTFADGRRLAYKPRALAAEAAFGHLLATLAQDDALPHQRRPWVLDAGDHGWMEWIEAAPLPAQEAGAAYMARCGGLAACLYVLRGSDIHPDNLIPAGAFPVIVDLECLFQPGPFDLGQSDPLDDPLLFSSGVLPVFTSFDGGASLVPIAGAGAGPVPMRPESFIRHASTDWLHLASHSIASFATGARWGAQVLDMRDHADAFAQGFEATLTAIWKRRAALLAPGGALERFRSVPCRLLCAPTNLYALVLDAALGGDAARDGDAFLARLGRAAGRPPLIGDETAWQAVLRAEAKAMARLDVPAFTFRPDGRTAMALEGASVGTVFRQSMYQRMAETLAGLDAAAIADTTALLRAALRPTRPAHAPDLPKPDNLSVVGRLADQILALSIPQGREAVAWVRLWENMPAFVAPAGSGLCYGAGGTAVFLAEAGRALDDDGLLAMARKALHPLRAAIRSGAASRLAERFGPGYGRGIGGMIAALSWCALLLDDAAMATDARTLAEATGQAIRVADTMDVMDGVSGLAFGLATLPTTDARAPLLACGRAILDASRLESTGRHWPERRGTSLPGLSHGSAGMAAALAHVHAATGGPEWLEAALDACAHEDTWLDPQTGNWQAGGSGPMTHRLSSWCHGAPGIALARGFIGALSDAAAGRLAERAALALATTRATPVAGVDDLCCGEAGRLAILSDLTTDHDAAGQSAIDDAIAARLPDWSRGTAHLLATRAPGAPGDAALFRGLAGIGHLLIRRAAPAFACDVLLPRPFSR